MKKWIYAFVLASTLVGCNDRNEETTSKAKEEKSSPKTEVIFWHAMSGDLEKALNEIVNDFNASQKDIEVKPVFQGTYEEALTKFNAVAGTKDSPTIMQTFEIGTKYMIESGKIEPIQTFIDQEGYDVSQWEKNIVNYYTVNGKIYSMPFNSSTPVLIYNKDAFKEVGLDSEKPPTTYSELKEAAKLLTKEGRYGFSILNYGWFFEQMVAVQGGLYVNEENGRKGEATSVKFNGEEGLRVFQLIYDMYKEGIFYNVGQNWDEMRAAFQSGKIAMYLDSSAGVRTIVDNAPFEVGVSYLPVPDGVERQGVVIGGASLWLMKDVGDEKKKAAWKFMKYVTTPEVQAKWHVNTGYFAINPAAYELPLVKEQWRKYPQLQVAVNQLKETKPTPATQGAFISVFPQARQRIVHAMESLYQGVDPKKALEQAANEVNRELEIANKR
ncbi:ABC transporter substrate-binding protein [Anoxybacillus ayderensis]|uniref:ABC transporter substrate-binding protein n=1 Tax=Anoxybacillus sp. ST70 TaxID=2864180 RepID=UPI0002E030F8|nr:ABC transporter substrate-binding protein [Anoxybacillus sp. ST70]AXM87752.1 ABC transporter substrate-binding protein [Anoxybacillus ayderensis G10]MBW9218483.1 ABC transporter substrate-binding protein [Anoxybacillus sp. ST70]THD16239.1 ABC transporter substrate-binding protein [Anoxybacillus ayderensis]